MQALTVVSSLAVPMQSRSNIVQSRAAMCLASFCYDADARRELRDSGAITSLVSHTHQLIIASHSKDIHSLNSEKQQVPINTKIFKKQKRPLNFLGLNFPSVIDFDQIQSTGCLIVTFFVCSANFADEAAIFLSEVTLVFLL